MPLFDHLGPAHLSQFTYRGWLYGVVPVYLSDPREASPLISTRNGVPEFWLDLWEALFDTFCTFAAIVAPDFVPTFPVTITGRLDGAPLGDLL